MVCQEAAKGGTKETLMRFNVCCKFMSFRCLELVGIVLAKEQTVSRELFTLSLVIISSCDRAMTQDATKLLY